MLTVATIAAAICFNGSRFGSVAAKNYDDFGRDRKTAVKAGQILMRHVDKQGRQRLWFPPRPSG